MTDIHNDICQHWRENPLVFAHTFWPQFEFYDKQIEIIESVKDNVETYVTAGNMLGKDFVAGFITLWFFLSNLHVRVLTTSPTEDHLDVLWAEIDRYIRLSKYPLTQDKGGPLRRTQHELYKVVKGEVNEDIYVKGLVATNEKKGEGLSGHHAPKTLAIIDEASGVNDVSYSMIQGWAKRILVIGNPNPCTNFYFKGVKGGDVLAD